MRKNFICVVVKTERRFRRTHTSDQRRRRRRSERRFEIIRSFGDFSRSGSARDFLFARRENNNENNNKARKKGRYSREKRGVFREIKSHLQISFAASFCVFSAGGSSVEEVFFAQNLRKRRSKRKKRKEREREKEISSPTRRRREKT